MTASKARVVGSSPIAASLSVWQGRNMDVYKEKLPAGLSYALKPSLLEVAIREAGIQSPISLEQRHKLWALNAPALSATFNPRGSYSGGEAGSFTVRSCAVRSSERKSLQDFSEHIFVPALVDWIKSIEALPSDSTIRREKQEFSCQGAPNAIPRRSLPLLAKGQRRRKRA